MAVSQEQAHIRNVTYGAACLHVHLVWICPVASGTGQLAVFNAFINSALYQRFFQANVRQSEI